MKRIHIIGGKNHGKTTLVTELVQELTARGMRVGTIKHTHHHHELDAPGKDSHRHRVAGAAAVGILSPAMNAVFWPPREDSHAIGRESRYDSFIAHYSQCSLVIVEGDSQTAATKFEVWRAAFDTRPLAQTDTSIAFVVTDDEDELRMYQLNVPALARSDISSIADALVRHAED